MCSSVATSEMVWRVWVSPGELGFDKHSLTMRTGLARPRRTSLPSFLAFVGMLSSPWAFAARSASILEEICSHPLLAQPGIPYTPKRRTSAPHPRLHNYFLHPKM